MILSPRLLGTFKVFDMDHRAERGSASKASRRLPSSSINPYVRRDRRR